MNPSFKIKVIVFIYVVTSLFTCLHAQNKFIENTGDVILFALPAATLATTFIVDDTKGSWQFTKAFLLTQGLTYGLKIAINKPRPFNNGDNAFPSGHTSTVFQSASFLHKRYGFKYSLPAYALASFTAFSRINAQKHDGWDILAGAVIGIGSTYLFTTEYQQEHMELTFNSNEGAYLIGFKYEF